ETRLANVGPWTTGGPQPPRMAFISDPAAGETIVLDLNAKTARRMKRAFAGAVPLQAPPAGVRNIEGGPTVVRNRVMATEAVGAGTGPAALPLPPLPPVGGAATTTAAFFRPDPKSANTEHLGKQTREGVLVQGSRHTVTIPTGEIGNDRPLVSVSERWSS